MGGNPARLIKRRDNEDIEKFMENLKNKREYIKIKVNN
jgi:hypothetical protein